MDFLQFLDFAGVAVFAATGALAASRKQLDIIGFLFLATVTGIGGGTLRDLLVGARPVFWMADGGYLAVCAATAVALYIAAPLVEFRYRLLLWLDAIGLSAYCVLGAQKGLEAGIHPVAAVAAGMMTATFGGIVRDVLSGEPSVLLRREIYITAALCGAAAYVALTLAGLPVPAAAAIGGGIAFAVRGGALYFGWTMPGYRHRPGRPSGEQ
jgi:uncharacterized membrane protein YeiH